MKKRSIVCLMVAALICSSAAIPANNIQEETITASASVYDEVPEGYTGIYTIDDLYAIRNNLSGKYVLMNDIDLSATAPGGDWDSGNGWLPINNFRGTFDGNGYAIKNMHIYGDASGGNYSSVSYGLFGKGSGNVCNLAVIDCNINLNVDKENVKYEGVYVGGIVGDSSTDIDNCYVSGNIEVNVSSEYNLTTHIGGICGECEAGGKISNVFNLADIKVNRPTNKYVYKAYIGGITGQNVSSTTNVYNAGNITYLGDTENNDYIGNVAGYNNISMKNFYYLKTFNDYTAIGNINNTTDSALTVAQMKSQAAFTGFDFDNVWTIDPNAEYPYPTLINVPYVSSQSSVVEPTQPTTQLSVSTGTKKGDMNGDGLVDAVDASLILAYYAYLSTDGTITDFDMWFNK